jgi:hypothetical protein
MMKTILSDITENLEKNGLKEVYSAFDSIPIERKGGGIFAVVSVDSFESSTPIYSYSMICLPFKAETGISLVAPRTMNLSELYGYFDKYVLPLTDGAGSMTCHLEGVTVKNDANIRKLVLKVKFSVTGMCCIERGTE